jgi:hypothetical protein
MRHLLFSFALLGFVACQNDKAAETSAQPDAPTARTSQHSAAFNQEFKTFLSAYYDLKESFVAENDTAIQSKAMALQTLTDSLAFPDLNAPDSVLAQSKLFKESILADLKGLLGEKDREEKRKAFEVVSEQVYGLAQAVQYDQEVVYRQFCPMAFNDKGAVWLSNVSDIRNPYLPKTMLHCGEVKDSLDASKPAR